MDVVVIALLACGVAGVALAPRNGTAWLLTTMGVVAAVAVTMSPLASAHHTPSAVASLQRYLVEAAFLLVSGLLLMLQVVYPDGRFERPWHRRVTVVVLVLAVLAPLALLFGSPSLTTNDEPGTRVRNVLALPGLAPLGRLGEVFVSVEPVWFFLGFGTLLLRFRAADGARRRELWPILGGLLALSAFLVPVVVEVLGGPTPPQPAFEILFRAALSVLPVVLLAGISRRTRLLARELEASRERIVTAEDAARRRIERDLHDGVQQQLVALLSLTELASRQARHRSPEIETTLSDVRDQITDAIDGLRELVSGIRPPVLEDSGVAAALESRLSRLPADVSLDDGTGRRRWSPQTEAAAYYVACEAVTNALKHAPGAPVRVRLRGDDDALRVQVEDDGPGLRGRPAGGGLTGLRDRVDSTGGTFSVSAGPAGGTVVRAEFAS